MSVAEPPKGIVRPITSKVEFSSYADVHEALFNPNLSRTFDTRGFDDGNVRDGVVSISHGAVHRARRRVENTQFRVERLRQYERELFPSVLDDLLDLLIQDERVDLFPLGELLSVVLAARRAGLDHEPDDVEALRTLVGYVDAFSQGSAIVDAADPDAVRALVRAALHDFEARFVRPSRARRQALIDRYRAGELAEDDLPNDILTVLLLHAADPGLQLDDGRIVREVATYLQGGTHTSSQTLINALDLIFPVAAREPAILTRIVEDRLFAQRCIHETLRLRPTTPKIKRYAEAETSVGGRPIAEGALVVLDAAAGNRDATLFGERPDDFDPDRAIDPEVPRWGLAFGAGPHQCPGRTVAGGLPVRGDFDAEDDHLFGLVAIMLRAVVRRGVRPDPDAEPERDTRTERYTRWARYPVLFSVRTAAGA